MALSRSTQDYLLTEHGPRMQKKLEKLRRVLRGDEVSPYPDDSWQTVAREMELTCLMLGAMFLDIMGDTFSVNTRSMYDHYYDELLQTRLSPDGERVSEEMLNNLWERFLETGGGGSSLVGMDYGAFDIFAATRERVSTLIEMAALIAVCRERPFGLFTEDE